MTPIWRPCSFTASAFRVLGSNFITALVLRFGFFIVRGIERAFFGPGRPLLGADEGLHCWNQFARNQQDVLVKNADEVEQGVEARHDLSGLDSGNMWLREADMGAELPLAPAALNPRLLYPCAQVLRQSFRPERLDTFS